jgi:hypothetical protein
MNGTLPLGFAKLLKFQLRRSFGYTDIRAIISLAAFLAFQPDVFSFTLFLRHKICSVQKLTLNNGKTIPSNGQIPPLFSLPSVVELRNDLRYDSCAYRSAAFTYREPQSFFHSYRGHNFYFHRYVVARQTHLRTLAFTALQ